MTSQLKVVSRNELFNGSGSEDESSPGSPDQGGYQPSFDFDIVDVEDPREEQEEEQEEAAADEKQEEAELFPMFSGPDLVKVTIGRVDETDDAYEKAAREQKRPDSYYFAKLTPEEEARYEQVAVSGDDVVRESQEERPRVANQYRLIDLNEYNDKIDRALAAEKVRQSKRPGKKKRLRKLEAKEKRQKEKALARELVEKAKKEKEKEEEKRRAIAKARAAPHPGRPHPGRPHPGRPGAGGVTKPKRKRGGRKHKGSGGPRGPPAGAPKFRTE